tara:strand:- start:1293 stop:2690 length:1398 start_codon:yes stop_codon:yes gene_type:complete
MKGEEDLDETVVPPKHHKMPDGEVMADKDHVEEGQPAFQKTPDAVAYKDFKKWAQKNEKAVKGILVKAVKDGRDAGTDTFLALRQVWLAWANKNAKEHSRIPNKGPEGKGFGRALAVMMKKDNLIITKSTNKLTDLNEGLARGLKPLLTLGSKVSWNTMSEDALLDLSEKFDDIDDEVAEDIVSYLNMSIENKQDGKKGLATKALKAFNKACKDALVGNPVKSVFEGKLTEALDKKDVAYQLSIDYTGNTNPKITKFNNKGMTVFYKYKIDPKDVIKSLYKLEPSIKTKHVGWSDSSQGGGAHSFIFEGKLTEAVYDNILKAIPDNYSYKALAKDVATIIKDAYGSHNIKPFIKELASQLKEAKLEKEKFTEPAQMRMDEAGSLWKHFDMLQNLRMDSMDLEDDMRGIAKELSQTHKDMEQEAEPEGGPKATKYGKDITKLEKEYKKKKAEFKKIMAKIDKLEQF